MPELKLQTFYGGSAVYLPGDTFGPRVLSDYELVWITAGDAVYHAEGVAHAAPAGTILLNRPGVRDRYVWDKQQPTRHGFFHFEVADGTWPADWPSESGWPLLRRTGGEGVMPALFAHVLRLYEHQLETGGGVGVELTRQVEALLSAFIHGGGQAGAARRGGEDELPPPVVRAMDWVRSTLRSSPDGPMDLDALAGAAKVTPKHLCRLFARSVGQPPMQWAMDRRLEQARLLLRRSNLSVQQVAHRCGFASPFHFSRAFKQRYGRPPTADRKLGG